MSIQQATHKCKMVEEIEFRPCEVDVVSTKLRTWNLKHAGNIFFTDVVHSRLPDITDDDLNTYRRVAEEIVDVILVHRGGRFLKLKEGDLRPTHCTVMNRRQCVSKTVHALRTASIRKEGRAAQGPGEEWKRPKSSKSAVAKSRKENCLPSEKGTEKATAKLGKRPKSDRRLQTQTSPESERQARSERIPHSEQNPKSTRTSNVNRLHGGSSISYQAQQGESCTIHKYALVLISSVCNQLDRIKADKVLDVPGGKYTIDNEPEKERRMRLQVR